MRGSEITSGADRDPTRAHHSVNRITLHQVLSSGLADILHYDREFVRYERIADGTIRCFFTDGSSADADVLVGADGGASRVRQQSRRMPSGSTPACPRWPAS